MNEGLIRSDLPDGMAQAQLHQIIALLARQLPDDPARASTSPSTPCSPEWAQLTNHRARAQSRAVIVESSGVDRRCCPPTAAN